MTMPTTAATKPMTIARFAEDIVRHYQEGGTVRDTLKLVRVVLSILETDAGVRTVAELERDNIADILRRFEASNANLSPHTRANRLRMLCAIIRRGHKLGLLRSVPPLPVTPQVDELPGGARTLPPTEDDVHRLMAHLAADETWRGRRLYVLASIVLLTRVAVEVATRLRVADVDFAAKKILCRKRWRGKSLESVEPKPVYLPDRLAEMLREWIPETKCEWIIPGYRREGHWSRLGGGVHTPLGRLKTAGRAAGVKPISFEQLRRFRADNPEFTLPAASSQPRQEPAVRLGKPNKPVFAFGKEKPPLSQSAHTIVSALLRAGTEGLTAKEIETKCKFGGWRKTLMRLRADSEWHSAIIFPGTPYGGHYRIAWWTPNTASDDARIIV
jgi:integrase